MPNASPTTSRSLCLVALLCLTQNIGCDQEDDTSQPSTNSSVSDDVGFSQTTDMSRPLDKGLIDMNSAKDMRQEEVDMPQEEMSTPDMSAPLTQPNILLIISDDQGLDSSAQYNVGKDLPNTPVLDALAKEGVVFEQAWATPACTTTRGTLISGLHGVHSGVDTVPDLLEPEVLTIQAHLTAQKSDYASAIIGKWHLGGRTNDLEGPAKSGVPYYIGTISGVIDDYWSWPLTSNGQQTTSTEYHTTKMTDLAVDWVGQQQKPWFLWLAYVAPHTPFHLPPKDLHTRQNLSGSAQDIRANPRPYYLAAIEAMDAEIGRLLDSLPKEQRENTIVIFVGDNGTPTRAVDLGVFERTHAKNSLYEGGVRVPLVVSGGPVGRKGEREAALVNTVDLFPTLMELTQTPSPQVALDGQSFAPLLQSSQAPKRTYNYTEFRGQATGWAVRNDTHKLLVFEDGTKELYNVVMDINEQNNLISQPEFDTLVSELEAHGTELRNN